MKRVVFFKFIYLFCSGIRLCFQLVSFVRKHMTQDLVNWVTQWDLNSLMFNFALLFINALYRNWFERIHFWLIHWLISAVCQPCWPILLIGFWKSCSLQCHIYNFVKLFLKVFFFFFAHSFFSKTNHFKLIYLTLRRYTNLYYRIG